MCFQLLRTNLRLFFFFFNDTATTEIYTLSLHDALPISSASSRSCPGVRIMTVSGVPATVMMRDRKSTRLNSSHDQISYAVFCLKKKKKTETENSISTNLTWTWMVEKHDCNGLPERQYYD